MRRQGAVFVTIDAVQRLAGLGLTPQVLEFALRAAEAEARTYTPLDPPSMAGMARYSRTVRMLREQLLPLGWSYDNQRNLARTVSPDGRVAIIAAYGDAATGDPRVVPSTRYEKGVATVAAVNRNFLQQPLPLDFGDGVDESMDDGGGPATWVLLYHVTDAEIRFELSLPDSMVEGYIDTWVERIVLAPIPLSDAPRPASWRPAPDRMPVVPVDEGGVAGAGAGGGGAREATGFGPGAAAVPRVVLARRPG